MKIFKLIFITTIIFTAAVSFIVPQPKVNAISNLSTVVIAIAVPYGGNTTAPTSGSANQNNTTTPIPSGTCSGNKYSGSTPLKDNVIVCGYLRPITTFLTDGIGIVIIAMMIIRGIQYITSDGNPQKTSEVKQKIFMLIIALILYGLLYAFLNFIIPGGIVTL